MAELVYGEDKEQGRGEGQAFDEVDQCLHAAQGVDTLLHGSGGGHRKHGQGKEQQVDPRARTCVSNERDLDQ